MFKKFIQFTMLLPLFFSTIALASDMSDAEQLRERCEREIKSLNVVVTNFGDTTDKANLDKAIKETKLGKVRIAQTKYAIAKNHYNNYLQLQYDLYKSLSAKYIKRTEILIDDIAIDMVDDIDNKKIEKYLKMASQNLKDAKSNYTGKHYKVAIDHCRMSKKYLLATYKVVNKSLPDKYKKDASDNDLKIHK